jgi:hypothetical protein
MLSLDELRRYITDAGNVEDLIALLVGGELILAKFEAMEVDAPDWIPAKIRQIKREIALKRSDALENKLAKAKMQLEQFKTPVEKKQALSSEIKRLEKQLAEV